MHIQALQANDNANEHKCECTKEKLQKKRNQMENPDF